MRIFSIKPLRTDAEAIVLERENCCKTRAFFSRRITHRFLLPAIGLLAHLAIAPTSSIAAGVTQRYQYDSLGRLIGTWDTLNINSQTVYDPASNRSTVTVTNAPPPPPANTGRLHLRQVRSSTAGKVITIVTP
ncbi:hypothetical protein N0A02_11650 [Paraburkholderia acidicola]|uniref:YD repeat-containing protein n=1 Tax=Paraburkholderia acidicola TaxID=1912599 RepID=A0ABV1LLB5_9BURK